MATVYLHIGTMKTGTSALQGFLSKNRLLLEREGYCYPWLSSKLGLPPKYVFRNAQFLVWTAKAETEEARRAEEQELQRKGYAILEKLAKTYDNIILSDEIIWQRYNRHKNFWPDLIDNMKKIGCDLKIIVYLRRQDMLIQSLWNQMVKGGSLTNRTFMECIDSNAYRFFPMNYYRHLKMLEQYVGKENLIVRVYERGQFEGEDHSIYSDFLQCVGLKKTEEYELKDSENNPGLSGNYIEIKRMINKIPEYRDSGDFLKKAIMYASSYQEKIDEKPKTTMFPPGEQEAFLNRYAESNRKVAREYLGREDGVLFREPLKELPTWKLDPENWNRDLMVTFVEMFCEQEKRIGELQDQVEEMRDEVEAMHKSLIFRSYRKLRNTIKRT